MICDLHGCTLIEAKDELLLKLEECQVTGDSVLEIVHGHHGGHVLRNYIRSSEFLKDSNRVGFKINAKDFSDDGCSFFNIVITPSYSSKVKTNSESQLKNNQSDGYIIKELFTLGVDNNKVIITDSNYQTQELVGCIEINPRERFYLKRDNDNLEIQFGDPLPGKVFQAMQGIVIIYNGLFNAVFGNELLIRNIRASYRDFYLRKDDYKESSQNQFLRGIKKIRITSSKQNMILQIQKVIEQPSKYHKLYKTNQKLMLSLNRT